MPSCPSRSGAGWGEIHPGSSGCKADPFGLSDVQRLRPNGRDHGRSLKGKRPSGHSFSVSSGTSLKRSPTRPMSATWKMGAFNLVSSQVMLVTDKQADIAILRTLGLSPGGVMQVFMVQGSLIGFMGTFMGVIGGIVLTFNLERILGVIETIFSVKLLPEDVYYITGLPTDMQTQDVVVITVVALVMSFLATLYPAWRASRTQPAEALRYE